MNLVTVMTIAAVMRWTGGHHCESAPIFLMWHSPVPYSVTVIVHSLINVSKSISY